MTAMQDIESRNQRVTEELLRLVNIMMNDEGLAQTLADQLAKEHRTIQQSFWRMIQTTANVYAEQTEGHTDLRNEGALAFTKKIAEGNDYLPFV